MKREKGESLIFIIFTEKLTTTLHIGLIYIHTLGSHNTIRKSKEKIVQYLTETIGGKE